MFSHTQFGLSFMMLTFDDSVNDYFARQQVAERFHGADLPAGISPDMAPLSTAIGEIYRYRLKGDGLDSRDLRTIQEWTVERQLKTVPGVADIVSFGGMIKQYEVNPNPPNSSLTTLLFNKSLPPLGAATRTPAGATSTAAHNNSSFAESDCSIRPMT